MDPFSHAVFGTSFAQLRLKNNKEKVKEYSAIGFLSAMSPDLDIFIRSKPDPLLMLEYHRHFTHSLFFSPVMAALCAAVFYLIFRKKLNFREIFFICWTSVISHCFLDAFTNYGTHIFWPISNERVSWGLISIIDPLFTIPLFIILLVNFFKADFKLAVTAVIFALVYFSIGGIQNIRVEKEIREIAKKRGHKIEHIEVKPSIGNNILWRTTYLHKGYIYADAIRVTWFGKTKLYEGTKSKHFRFPDNAKKFGENTVLYKDIGRFNFFSDNFLITREDYPNILIDGRYSLDVRDTKPMWGIAIDKNKPEQHIKFKRFPRDIEGNWDNFENMLWGKDITTLIN